MKKTIHIDLKLLEKIKLEPELAITLFASLVFFGVFFGISVVRYNTFQYHDWDFSIYANSMWNIIHGKAFITIYDKPFLGNHFTPIAFLIAPIYFITRCPLTLIFLKTLSLSLVTIPIYYTAKRKFAKKTSIYFALLYLFYPALLFVTLYEFHFEDFAPLFLGSAFFFLIAGKLAPFIIFSFLAMLCKENIPLITGFMGMSALLFRPNRRKMGLIVLIVSVLYFLLVTLRIQPMFTPGSGIGYAHHYSEYGKDFFSVFKFFLFHPITIAKTLFSNAVKIKFFKDLFNPLLFIPLLSPDILIIAFPIILKNLLSKIPTAHTIYWHYTSTIIPFLIFSTIFSFKRFSKFILIRKHINVLLIFLILTEIALSYKIYNENNQSKYFVKLRTRLTSNNSAKQEAIELIPKDASCIATFDFLPKLSQRKEIYTFYMLWKRGKKYDSIPDTDYAIIDFNDYFVEKDFHFVPSKISEIFSEYTAKSNNWHTLYAKNDTIVLSKNPGEKDPLIEVMDFSDFANKSPRLIVDDSLELLDLSAKKIPDSNIVHLVFYWHTNSPGAVYRIFFSVSKGISGKVLAIHSPGYRYFLPDLNPDKVLKENYWLIIPEDKDNHSNYTLSMGFADIMQLRKVKIEALKNVRYDKNGRILIDITE